MAKASAKTVDMTDTYMDISSSMVLDNIINQKFEKKEFESGVSYISKYAGMIVGLKNLGISEDGIVEIIIETIKKS